MELLELCVRHLIHYLRNVSKILRLLLSVPTICQMSMASYSISMLAGWQFTPKFWVSSWFFPFSCLSILSGLFPNTTNKHNLKTKVTPPACPWYHDTSHQASWPLLEGGHEGYNKQCILFRAWHRSVLRKYKLSLPAWNATIKKKKITCPVRSELTTKACITYHCTWIPMPYNAFSLYYALSVSASLNACNIRNTPVHQDPCALRVENPLYYSEPLSQGNLLTFIS